MNSIARHIEFLALTHDCIVVPGFGAFLLHDNQAYIDGSNFFAPHRTLAFNPDLTQDDGLLVSSVARQNSIDMAQAKELVSQEVERIKTKLAANSHLSFGKLGFLMQSSADAPVRFVPAVDISIDLKATWLPEINISEYSVAEPVADLPVDVIKINGFKKYVAGVARYAAAAIVLAIIGFAASTPVNVDDATMASLALQTKAAQTTDESAGFVYTPSAVCPTIVLKYEPVCQEDTMPVKAPEQTIANEKPAKPVKDTALIDWRLVDSDPYCVIIASLNNAEDAAEYVSTAARRGLTCGVLEQDGRYRIYAATAPNQAMAQRAVNTLTLKYKGAWICRR